MSLNRKFGLLFSVAALLGLLGGAWISQSSSGSEPEALRPMTPLTYKVGQESYRQESVSSAISDTLKGLDGSYFRSVSLQNGPSGGGGAPWLDVNMRLDDSTATMSSIGAYEADLAEGAVAERMAGASDDLADVIGGVSGQVVQPDGSIDALQVASGMLRQARFSQLRSWLSRSPSHSSTLPRL